MKVSKSQIRALKKQIAELQDKCGHYELYITRSKQTYADPVTHKHYSVNVTDIECKHCERQWSHVGNLNHYGVRKLVNDSRKNKEMVCEKETVG
jgi:hypothetical protein